MTTFSLSSDPAAVVNLPLVNLLFSKNTTKNCLCFFLPRAPVENPYPQSPFPFLLEEMYNSPLLELQQNQI